MKKTTQQLETEYFIKHQFYMSIASKASEFGDMELLDLAIKRSDEYMQLWNEQTHKILTNN